MSQVIPHLLIQIVDFLKKSPVALSKQSRDGRINSAFNEDEIFKRLETNFAINRPNMRDWVDFSFEENNIFYPVNIKVSTTKTTDNLNCKLGIYYALTGKIPPFGNGVSWDCYFKSLKENIQQNSKDYYFLIINKDNSSDVFATSLKNLESILPNGNNLPFQAKWDNNRKLINRDFESAKAFLLGTFEESLKLRADAYLHFKKYFYES
ncbi:restriction endonuclease [Helicobacter typhlonius]|uniref:restriction endonuclease n=1 Tax=Helicobacter typhlonius TaxID=76936 RepID=UPI002FDFA8AB